MNDISTHVNLAFGYLYLVVKSACYLPYFRTVIADLRVGLLSIEKLYHR